MSYETEVLRLNLYGKKGTFNRCKFRKIKLDVDSKVIKFFQHGKVLKINVTIVRHSNLNVLKTINDETKQISEMST